MRGDGQAASLPQSRQVIDCNSKIDCRVEVKESGNLKDLAELLGEGREGLALMAEFEEEIPKHKLDGEAFARAIAIAKANARSPIGFARKCILRDLIDGKYDRPEKEPLNGRDLLREMEENGFDDDSDGYGYTRVDLWLQWYWEETPISIAEVRKVARGSFDYCIKHDMRRASSMIALFMKSRILNGYSRDHGAIREWSEKQIDGWKESDREWERFLESL